MFQRLNTSMQSGVVALLLFVSAAGLSGFEVKTALAGNVMDGAVMDRFGRENNLCAITFDDGPGKHTERLLDILRAHGVRATFFLLGERIARNPATVQRMLAEGHEVANHTYSHKSLRHMSEEAQRQEIGRVQDLLQSHGIVSKLLRPPFGRYDATTVHILTSLGMRVALWSADSQDWQRRASLNGITTVYGVPARSGVILFHDTHQPTVDAMDEILTGFEAGQCRFVTMSEFMELAEARTVDLPKSEQAPPHAPSTEAPKAPAPEPAPPAATIESAAMESPGWTMDGVIGAVRGWAQELWGDKPRQTARY